MVEEKISKQQSLSLRARPGQASGSQRQGNQRGIFPPGTTRQLRPSVCPLLLPVPAHTSGGQTRAWLCIQEKIHILKRRKRMIRRHRTMTNPICCVTTCWCQRVRNRGRLHAAAKPALGLCCSPQRFQFQAGLAAFGHLQIY